MGWVLFLAALVLEALFLGPSNYSNLLTSWKEKTETRAQRDE